MTAAEASAQLLGLELYQEARLAILAVDPSDFSITEANATALELFGHSALVGRSVGDLVPETVRDHGRLMRGWLDDGGAPRHMASRILAGVHETGQLMRLTILLRTGKIRGAKRIIVVLFGHGEDEAAAE